jgi:hypothetical protein
MKDNLREEDSEVRSFGVRVEDIPAAETYITPKGVHRKLLDWDSRVSWVRESDQLVAIIEVILLGVLLRQAYTPDFNANQKAIAIWLIVNRAIITGIFQYQMKKMAAELEKQLCKNGPKFSYPSFAPEIVGLATAITYGISTVTFNRGKVMDYIVFPIHGIEFFTIWLRILISIVLGNQALTIVTAHKAAQEETGVRHPNK